MTSGHFACMGQAVEGNDMTTERVSNSSVSEKSMFIRDFARELDGEERHCVILRHIHGLSVSEIAEVINCSERLVQSLLQGVETKLRESMKQESPAFEQAILV